jgi:hypothetical protein
LAANVFGVLVTTLAQRFLKPASLTDCVFKNSTSGKLKHFLWRNILNGGRALDGKSEPDAATAGISSELTQKGLVIGDASRFLTPAGEKALSMSTAMIRERCAGNKVQEILNAGINRELGKNYLVHIVPFTEKHSPDSPLLQLALDVKLLNIVANYMGMSPRLHAIGSWLNFPTGGEAKASQLWHRDPEDLKTVKVFIYLDEVTKENGPFTYILNTHPFGSASQAEPRHEHPRRVTDDEMNKVFPAGEWFQCTGSANTMVIADTVGFHRGGNVSTGQRLLITFTYTSGAPQVKPWLEVDGSPGWITEPIQRKAL